MTYTVRFAVRVIPGEFQFTYLLLDGELPNGDNAWEKNYPSQAELEDDLRAAGLPLRLSLVGTHDPVEATDQQLAVLRREADQDYR